MARTPVLLSWSGGKDCCMALEALRQDPAYEVAGLVTTIGQEDGRIAIHDVPRALIAAQAAALGVPITFIPLPSGADNACYERTLAAALEQPRLAHIGTIAFGDLHLADIRAWREALMARLGRRSIFPLWNRDPHLLLHAFVTAGYRAIAVSVDATRLDRSFAGRPIDADFAADLPPGIDPCGENGEFHSFVWDGPIFSAPVAVRAGGTRTEHGMHYRAIEPA